MNPDSGVPLSGKQTVDGLADQWAKILSVIMFKHNLMDVTLTSEDIEKLGTDGEMKYCLCPGPGNTPLELRIRLMKTEEAIKESMKRKSGFGNS